MFNKNLTRSLQAVSLAVVSAMLFAAPAAEAAKLRKQNLTQLIAQSESIIYGTVEKVTDGFEGGMPYTEVTIQVGSAAKGNIDDQTAYTFRQWGLTKPRKMENGMTYFGVSPEGFAQWVEGETVVAFMYKPAKRTGLQTTAGMSQGKFTLQNGKLTNEFNNAGLFDGVEINESLLSAEDRNLITSPGPVDAAAFMDLVGRAVEGQWIASGEMK